MPYMIDAPLWNRAAEDDLCVIIIQFGPILQSHLSKAYKSNFHKRKFYTIAYPKLARTSSRDKTRYQARREGDNFSRQREPGELT